VTRALNPLLVMPGLDPGIHQFKRPLRSTMDGRVKPGHDEPREITSDRHASPDLNGSSFSGGTDCSAIARIIATIT